MPINLKSFIEDESAVKIGGFSGAVFLTYTLNLGFYEQIIAPALERAGCSNILIIADPDGYAEAMEMGLKNVAYAGMRYVCTTVPRRGYGVQHAKILLMAGANRGRLLIGSGNLTLHGYSRNLEIFSRFEYDHKNPDLETQQAFHSVWELIQDLSQDGSFSPSAQRQMDVISAKASWLVNQLPGSDSFFVWNNYNFSLWSQFMGWREKSGLLNSPVRALKIFSPYYDQDSGMLRKFTDTFLPNEVNLYVSRENTTLNGQELLINWPKDYPEPQLSDIREAAENQGQRLLHGKLIVGIEDTGSWCISGSANMTRAAFDNSWRHGSNLEMVTFRWSPDPTAFNYLFEKPILVTPIEINSLNSSDLSNNSENPKRVTEDTILLTELALDNKFITGRLNLWPGLDDKEAELVFLKSGKSYSITINDDLGFQIPYTNEIRTSESAFIRGKGFESLPRWIDIPAILQEYGSRSYHERIQSKLDTVEGAESLFHELMEFLIDRALPDQPSTQNIRRSPRRSNDDKPNEAESNDAFSAPDVDRFVVPERDPTGSFQIGRYTRLPYDHNIQSLRDLLSIVLLKLTAGISISTETTVDDDGENKQGKNKKPQETETETSQINARQRLCNYLIDYCKRYSKRICQNDFIERINPEILIDNHLTLSRVLLEFNSHIIEFLPDDFIRCYWLIWASLFSPTLVGMKERSSWQLFVERGMENDFVEAWNKFEISPLLVAMTSSAMGRPPSWSSGLRTPEVVTRFLTLKELILKIKNYLKINFEKLTNPVNLGIRTVNWDESYSVFNQTLEYIPPARERLSPIFDWIENSGNQTKLSEILSLINKAELTAEFSSYKSQPKPIFGIVTAPDDEGLVYCPRCGGSLRSNSITEIDRGKLVLCSTSSDAWLYKTEKPTKKVM